MSQQPNDSNSTSNKSSTNRRECLYSILDIKQSANTEEVKAAYKKQARKWHPDKNIDNADEATKRFKEINEAYEILSDKHERAWYDAHRDAILRGIDKHEINKMAQNNEDYDPNIDLMPYFSPFIFTSFDDNDSNSYYNIYNDLFKEIINLEKLSKKKTPLFGNSKLSYHKMKEFYDYWEQFESRRSFQWTTKYNLNDAQNRKIRKLMHKENRKLVDTKRKKWEETILKLVQFIKKRDPRFRNYLIDLDKQRIEEEQKIQEYQREIDEIMKEEQRKQRQIEIEQHQKLLEEKDDNDSEAEEIFECVVCNKIFKSQNAFNTHESSKKHIKALENLKFQLELENDLIFNNDKDEMKTNEQSNVDAMIAKQLAHRQKVDNDDTNTTTTTTDNDEEEEESEPQTKKKADDGPIDLDYLIALTMEQEDIMETMDLFDDDINDKDNKSQNRSALITDSEIIALLESGIDIESLTNTYPELTKEYIIALKQRTKARQNGNNKDKKKRKNKRKNKRKKRSSSYNQDEQIIQNNDDNDGIEEQQNDENDDGDDEEEQLDAFMNQFKSFKKKSDFINRQKNKQRSVSHNDADNDNDNNNSTKKKRRRRRNKNKDTHSQRNIVSSSTTSPIKSKCKACETTFSSKNKLYDHLKQFPKHALKSQH
mmetsp:Transcript_73604/g.66239  ORF Transcript_73604/g.66239 Transcript_73604/m.66239 type:complete len:653 (-) Transcript_73604:11-1969(-)